MTGVARTSSLMGRPSLVLSNLLQGDAGAAVRAGLSPESLSPEEARTIVERMGLDEGPWAAVYETVTNPLVLLGIVLSMRFPVPTADNIRKVSKDVQRAVGAGATLPPWARKAQSAYGIFRDKVEEVLTPLSNAGRYKEAFKNRHQGKLLQALQKYEKESGHALTRRDMRLAVYHLDGLARKDAKLFETWGVENPLDVKAIQEATTPALKGLVEGVREVFEDIWVDVAASKSPEFRSELAEAAKKAGVALEKATLKALKEEGRIPEGMPRSVYQKLRTTSSSKAILKDIQKEGGLPLGQYMEDYWPRMLHRDEEEFKKGLQALMESVKADPKLVGARAAAKAEREVSKHLYKRMHRMVPDPEELREFPEFLHAGRMRDYEEAARDGLIRFANPKETGGVLRYRLDFMEPIDSYVHSMGATYAMNMRGSGRKLAEAVDELAKDDPFRTQVLRETLIPMVAGKMTVPQAIKRQWSDNVRYRLIEFTEGLMNKPVGKELGAEKGLLKWVQEGLKKPASEFSMIGSEGKLASLMYTAALGGNVGSVSKNLLQTLLTTVPVMGTYAIEGLKDTVTKIPKYYEARFTKKMDKLDALKTVFPEFVDAGYGGHHRLTEVMGETLESSWAKATLLKPKLNKAVDKTQQAMMFLFEESETFNQLVAWQGALKMARKQGLTVGGELLRGNKLPKESLQEFASWIVDNTQFPASIVNTPLWLLGLKQRTGGRLLGMFGQFTGRALEFVSVTAPSIGSAEKAWMGRNWGTLGRAALVGGLTYEAGMALGADLSEALIFGALPTPREGAPFFPSPFVPPAASVAGSAVMDLVRGEWDQMRYALPLAVPGGIAAARAVTFADESTAKMLGRKYADWRNPNPDGTVPVYSMAKGAPVFVGNHTPGQILMKALGIPGAGDPAREVEAMAMLRKNLPRIRQYRRDFMEAMLVGDGQKMSQVSDAFDRAYPINGGIRSTIRKSDVEMLQLRRSIPRLQALLETIPKDLRPMFSELIQYKIFGEGERFLGRDLTAMSVGGGRRGGARNVPGLGGMGGGYQRNAGPMDINANPDQIARQALPTP